MKQKISVFWNRGVAFLLAFLIFSFCFPVYGAEEQREVIRVGFFAFDGYHMMDENGERSGYGYDFLRLTARYLDVEYEYIGYDKSWEEMVDMLETGEIDLLTSAQITPEREEKFAFSKPIGTSSAILTVKNGNTDITAYDYDSYNGMRVAMLKGNSRNAEFAAYAKEHHFTYKPVYFDYSEDLGKALQEGKVDATLTNSLRRTNNEWILDSFATQNFYVMVRKDDTALLEKINYAIEQISAAEGDWVSTLDNRYYSHDDEKYLAFTDAEQNILRQYSNGEKTLTVTANIDKSPYSYEENGELKGIIIDYFDKLAAYLGISYEVIVPKDREEYLKWYNDGTADLFLDVWISSEKEIEEKGYSVTAPYTTMRLARVVRRNFDGRIDRIAITEAQTQTGVQKTAHEEAARIKVKTREDALRAVRNGDADAAFVYLYTAQEFINKDSSGMLTYTLLQEPTYAYSMVFSDKVTHELAGILTKAIYAMPTELFEDIATQYTSYKVEHMNLATWIKIYPLTTVVFCGIFFFCSGIIILFIHRNKTARLERERIAELQEMALRAESASRAKTDFLANMSHDIRTPMNAIVGITDLMQYEPDVSDKMHDYIQKIQISSRHLLGLLNDVLDMSKIESTEVSLNEQPINLPDQIGQVDNIIRAQALPHGQTVLTRFHRVSHNYLLGDGVRLRQVLLNLLSNSVKYTKDGGCIHLDIAEYPCDREGFARFRFIVADNGSGMSAEVQEHIFEPFSRGEDSVTNKIQGTGLGMAITKTIIDLMHGEIEIHSTLGTGTTISVTLEMKIDQKADYRLDAKSLLLISEEETLRFNMARFFQKAEASFASVANEKEAAELLRQEEYEVILLAGYLYDPALSERISRLRENIPHGTYIFCLDYIRRAQDELLAEQADGFLSRPFYLSNLNLLLLRAKANAAESETAVSILQGMHFLCAEDNLLNAEILEAMLNMCGASCDIYPDGAALVKAFEAVEEGQYAAVLMDIQMPNMNGLEAATAIRNGKNPIGRTIPIIAMTANAFTEDIQECMAAGMDAHIAKPLDIAVLEKTMIEFVTPPRLRRGRTSVCRKKTK